MRLTESEQNEGQLSPERLAEAIRTFQDTGIVLMEDVYDAAFIAEMRTAYDAELEKYLESRGGIDAMEGKTFGKNHIGFFPPMFPPLADARVAAHPIAVQLLIALLGRDVQCSFYHTNTAYPGSGIQPIHRDQQHLFGTELSVAHPPVGIVLNIPLCDFTEANGSTEYWPGTHLIVDKTPDEGKNLEQRAAQLPSVRLNMPVGSFALRDLRAWHRGMPNNADYPRTMMAIVYQRGFIAEKSVTIPRSTWEAWPEAAQHIFRKNRVVEDSEHTPQTW